MLALAASLLSSALAQQQQTSVLLMSDLHFDPMQDPAKVTLLARAPIVDWPSILASPPSPDQAVRFAEVQSVCSAKGNVDSSYDLLRSVLAAAKVHAADAAFVMVSGDLIVHDLDCRFRAAMHLPPDKVDDQSVSAAFAEKTTLFIMQQLEANFDKAPVYFALGNNDSRCNHNRLDAHDEYLHIAAPAVIAGLRGAGETVKATARGTFEAGGYYMVDLPAPMQRTRLLVINDVYLMPKYTNCEAAVDNAGQEQQLTFLQQQLDIARLQHRRVWLLGHLPPAINPAASLAVKPSICKGGEPVSFQSTEDLAQLITANDGTIRLGLFGHTHMDEFHLVQSGSGAGVPIKVIPAVSPVDGNRPSFIVARVDPLSATIPDYTVYQASNTTGVDAQWSVEYSFDKTYGEPGFTPVALADIVARLRRDVAGTDQGSRTYQQHFLKGATGKKLSPSWAAYVCSLDHVTAQGFTQCFCDAR
jgi:sphingomyelin phosphodiesterase acid-like 3